MSSTKEILAELAKRQNPIKIAGTNKYVSEDGLVLDTDRVVSWTAYTITAPSITYVYPRSKQEEVLIKYAVRDLSAGIPFVRHVHVLRNTVDVILEYGECITMPLDLETKEGVFCNCSRRWGVGPAFFDGRVVSNDRWYCVVDPETAAPLIKRLLSVMGLLNKASKDAIAVKQVSDTEYQIGEEVFDIAKSYPINVARWVFGGPAKMSACSGIFYKTTEEECLVRCGNIIRAMGLDAGKAYIDAMSSLVRLGDTGYHMRLGGGLCRVTDGLIENVVNSGVPRVLCSDEAVGALFRAMLMNANVRNPWSLEYSGDHLVVRGSEAIAAIPVFVESGHRCVDALNNFRIVQNNDVTMFAQDGSVVAVYGGATFKVIGCSDLGVVDACVRSYGHAHLYREDRERFTLDLGGNHAVLLGEYGVISRKNSVLSYGGRVVWESPAPAAGSKEVIDGSKVALMSGTSVTLESGSSAGSLMLADGKLFMTDSSSNWKMITPPSTTDESGPATNEQTAATESAAKEADVSADKTPVQAEPVAIPLAYSKAQEPVSKESIFGQVLVLTYSDGSVSFVGKSGSISCHYNDKSQSRAQLEKLRSLFWVDNKYAIDEDGRFYDISCGMALLSKKKPDFYKLKHEMSSVNEAARCSVAWRVARSLEEVGWTGPGDDSENIFVSETFVRVALPGGSRALVPITFKHDKDMTICLTDESEKSLRVHRFGNSFVFGEETSTVAINASLCVVFDSPVPVEFAGETASFLGGQHVTKLRGGTATVALLADRVLVNWGDEESMYDPLEIQAYINAPVANQCPPQEGPVPEHYLLSDVKEAGVRIAASQACKMAMAGLRAKFGDGIATSDPVVSAALSFLAGVSLGDMNHPLARELRVRAVSGGMDALIDELIRPVSDALKASTESVVDSACEPVAEIV